MAFPLQKRRRRSKVLFSGGEDPLGDVSAGAGLHDSALRLSAVVSPPTVDFYDKLSRELK